MPPSETGKYLDQATKLLDPRTREIEPADGDLTAAEMQVREVNVDERTITAVVSTGNIDRFEEIIEPSAYRQWLDTFMTNPVFLAGHKHVGFDAAEPTVIGHWTDMRITDDGLVGTAKFAETPLAQRYWSLYRDGHMRAFSVGVIVHEWEMREFELTDGVTKKIRVLTDVELIEVSAVAVPANRESLVRAASALDAFAQLQQAEGGSTEEKGTGDGDGMLEAGRAVVEKHIEELAERVSEQTAKLLSECLCDPEGPMVDALAHALAATGIGDPHADMDAHDNGAGGEKAEDESDDERVINQIDQLLTDLRARRNTQPQERSQENATNDDTGKQD